MLHFARLAGSTRRTLRDHICSQRFFVRLLAQRFFHGVGSNVDAQIPLATIIQLAQPLQQMQPSIARRVFLYLRRHFRIHGGKIRRLGALGFGVCRQRGEHSHKLLLRPLRLRPHLFHHRHEWTRRHQSRRQRGLQFYFRRLQRLPGTRA